MQVISVPIEVVSHSLQFPFPIPCFIPIPMAFPWDSHGIPIPSGNPIPMQSVVERPYCSWRWRQILTTLAKTGSALVEIYDVDMTTVDVSQEKTRPKAVNFIFCCCFKLIRHLWWSRVTKWLESGVVCPSNVLWLEVRLQPSTGVRWPVRWVIYSRLPVMAGIGCVSWAAVFYRLFHYREVKG